MADYFSANGSGLVTTGDSWNSVAVTTNETSQPFEGVYLKDTRTLFFLSDSGGTLTVQTKEPDGDWQDLKDISISANTLKKDVLDGDFIGLRVKFSTGATVTGWHVLRT